MKPNRREFMRGSLGALMLAPGALRQDLPREPDCPVTPENIEGPFWKPDAPVRKGGKLRLEGEEGKILVVHGTIEGYPSCKSLPGAVVDVWQADHEGEYDNRGFDLRGKFRADGKGWYEYETILPGRYEIGRNRFRPAHIHYKVTHPGHAPLTTQLYFEGDPHLRNDPWAKKALTKRLERTKTGRVRCRFDIRLRKADRRKYGSSYGGKD